MPIYEYRCEECKQLFEEWCKHVEDESTPHACPICKGHAERIMSHTSFALKGGGWYVTEYGSRKGENSGKEASPKNSKSGAGESAGSGCASAGSCMGASCASSCDAGVSAGSGHTAS